MSFAFALLNLTTYVVWWTCRHGFVNMSTSRITVEVPLAISSLKAKLIQNPTLKDTCLVDWFQASRWCLCPSISSLNLEDSGTVFQDRTSLYPRLLGLLPSQEVDWFGGYVFIH